MKHLQIPLEKGSQTNKKNFLSKSSSSSSSSSIFPVTPITKVRVISHDRPGRVKMIELPKNEASNGNIWPAGLIYIDHFFQGFGRWNKSKNEPIWVAAVSYPTTPPRVPVVSRSHDQLAVIFFKPSFHLLTPITPEELTSTQRFFLAPKNVERENLWIPYIFETKAWDLRPPLMLWMQIHGCIRTSNIDTHEFVSLFHNFWSGVYPWSDEVKHYLLNMAVTGRSFRKLGCMLWKKMHQFLSVGLNFVLNHTGLEKRTHLTSLFYHEQTFFWCGLWCCWGAPDNGIIDSQVLRADSNDPSQWP